MYIIRDREAGNIIDMFYTLADAENELRKYEEADKADGTYEEDFYEIVADPECFYRLPELVRYRIRKESMPAHFEEMHLKFYMAALYEANLLTEAETYEIYEHFTGRNWKED